MVQLLSNPNTYSTDFDHHVVLFPTRPAAPASTGFTVHPAARTVGDPWVRRRTDPIRGVVVLEAGGRLRDVVKELDRAIQLALAEVPRGVVCDLSAVLEGADLSAVLEGADLGAVEVLATAGRHVRDWSGIPVAVACPDPRVRAALVAHPLGGHLIVTASVFSAVSAVLATPNLTVEWLRLGPHSNVTRASREFVTRTLLGWGLDPLILSADLVVSELVTSSTRQNVTCIDLSVAWNSGALRLTVRDSSPDLPRQRYTHFDLYGSRLTAVAGLSRAFGVLPSADGGRVAWAVLNATRPRRSSNRGRPAPATVLRDPPRFTDGPGLAGFPLFAAASPLST